MNGAGSDAPPVDGGEFLLNLLNRRPTHHHHQQQPPPPPSNLILSNDPAVAAFGPTVPVPVPVPHHHQLFPSGAPPPPPWAQQFQQASPPSHLGPHGYYFQSPNPSPNLNHFLPSASPPGIAQFGARNSGFVAPNSNLSSAHQQDVKDLVFGSIRASEGSFNPLAPPMQNEKILDLLLPPEDRRNLEFLRLKEQRRQLGLDGNGRDNGFGMNSQNPSSSDGSNRRGTGYWDGPGNSSNSHGAVATPPGFSNQQNNGGGVMRARELRYQGVGGGRNEMERRLLAVDGNRGLSRKVDHPGPPAGSILRSAPASVIEESMMANHAATNETGRQLGNGMMMDGRRADDLGGNADVDELEEHLVDSLGLGDETDDKTDQKKPQGMRDKEYRSDKRGQYMMGQRLRLLKRQIACRGDIDRWNAPLLAIYESLIPAEEEKAKQKQLLTLLEKVVWKEWPEARLFLYGSCANSFGFSKSDIDVCLTIADPDINKAVVLLKLSDLLQLENLQNVQALTRARVPIVKLMDPATGISCDICINNVLAVVNTKLLRDYAQIDKRLRQLVFLVKHWAKSRGVNETYQGTLSSYAYVLMCIHFLQHRRPAILPCLQEMKTTYSVRIGNVGCSFFDQVETLAGFGSRNGETIAQLVWSFFNYWAYCHDYANDVISVRTGTILSKRHKDWTRRVGNDRHLICIEDPFETSHDLGRVVDKRSIRVLREEFERAAEVIQHDPNPCVKLFEPYVPS